MENALNPFRKKIKISLDLDKEFLEIIDKLANLTKTNRTSIIEALLSRGIFPYFDYLKNTWEEYLKDKRYEKIKKDIEILLENLKEIKSKHGWLNSNYYWDILSNKKLDEETKKKIIDILQDIKLEPPDKKKFK